MGSAHTSQHKTVEPLEGESSSKQKDRETVPVYVREDLVLDVWEVAGIHAGPTVSLIGGVHGDEEEGVLAVRRAMRSLDPASLSGRVRALAVANPLAYAASVRETPEDGLNLARVFPGDDSGSVTERIAYAITKDVISGSDLMIDLHSAGSLYDMPLFCGFCATGDEAESISEEAVRAFGAPLSWRHDQVTVGRTISAAVERNIPCLYAEAPGGGRVRGRDLDAYVNGVLRTLNYIGMLPDAPAATATKHLLIRGGDGDLDRSISSAVSGILVSRATVGELVGKGELLAEIFDDLGALRQEVLSPADGMLMMLRRRARVSEGEPVALCAPEPLPWDTE